MIHVLFLPGDRDEYVADKPAVGIEDIAGLVDRGSHHASNWTGTHRGQECVELDRGRFTKMLPKVTVRPVEGGSLIRSNLLAINGRSDRAVMEFGRVDPLQANRNPVLIVHRWLVSLAANRGP